MTIRQLLNLGAKKTKSALDAEVLLVFAIKQSKEYLYANPGIVISQTYIRTYIRLLKQRAKRTPVAYLTGEKEFFGLKFLVNRHVLIPRPETESLVNLVLRNAQSVRSHKSGVLGTFKILDLGTGSGCMIISLAKTLETNPSSGLRPPSPVGRRELLPDPKRLGLPSPTGREVPYLTGRRGLVGGEGFEYFASDISGRALAVARKNARRHKVKIKFRQGSLLEPWRNERFDIIVANLPYLARLEHPSTKFEPRIALVAKNKGLALIEGLLRQLAEPQGESLKFQKRTPLVALEFDPRQARQIKKLAQNILGPAYDLKIYKDLSGRNRFAVLTIKRS